MQNSRSHWSHREPRKISKDDDCAVRPVPAAAADRLRKYANSLRAGSGGTAANKPDH